MYFVVKFEKIYMYCFPHIQLVLLSINLIKMKDIYKKAILLVADGGQNLKMLNLVIYFLCFKKANFKKHFQNRDRYSGGKKK